MDEDDFSLNVSRQKSSPDMTSTNLSKANFRKKVRLENKDEHQQQKIKSSSVVPSNENRNNRNYSTLTSEIFPLQHDAIHEQNALSFPMNQYHGTASHLYNDLNPFVSSSDQYERIHCDELSEWLTDDDKEILKQNIPSNFFDFDIDTLF
jgi:hypothetical protein